MKRRLLFALLMIGAFDLSNRVEAQEHIRCSHVSGKSDSSFVFTASSERGELRFETGGTFVSSSSPRWPDSLVINRTTALELALFDADTLVERSHRFFAVDIPTHFPILAVSTAGYYFWDSVNGISVRGPNAYFDTTSGFWRNNNYEKKWEREVNIVYIEDDGEEVINQRGGIRVFGGMSRHLPQKSYRVIAREEYGKKRFKHQFFEHRENEKFKTLVLRNGSTHYNKSKILDVFATQLAKELGLEIQEAQPVTLYINEEYQGIYNLREHIRGHYLEANWGGDRDSMDLIQGHSRAENGDSKGYFEMFDWIKNTDLSDDSFLPQLFKWMDVRNYFNFMVVQIYLNNVDSMGNIRFWRKDDSTPFRWILYDTDLGLGHSRAVSFNYMQYRLSRVQTDWFNPQWSTAIITNLLENDSLKKDFIHQVSYITSTTFEVERFESVLDSLVDLYAHDVEIHRNRIGQLDKWEYHIKKIREYGQKRPPYMLEYTRQQFDLDKPYRLEIVNEHPERGHFRINDNAGRSDSTYSGWYFSEFPLKVEWVPNRLYQPAAEPMLFVSAEPGDTLRLQPHFEPSPMSPYAGKVKLNEWHPARDSVAPWIELISLIPDTIPGLNWTFWTASGEFDFEYANMGKATFYLEDSLSTLWSDSSHVRGWWRMLDEEGLVIDSISWSDLQPSGVYERIDSIGHGLQWIQGPGTPASLNPNQQPPQKRASIWLVLLLILGQFMLVWNSYFKKEKVNL